MTNNMTKTVLFFSPGREAELQNVLDGFRPIAAAWNQQTEAASPKLRKGVLSAAQR